MQSIKKLDQEIEIASNVKSLAIAYEEISVMRMQKIRDGVLNNRYYLENLYPVFKETRKTYVDMHMNKSKLSKFIDSSKSNFSTIEKNGKVATVLITPNNRMSGNLAKSVIADFLDGISRAKQNTEYIVIGKLGERALKSAESKLKDKTVLYFDSPKVSDEAKIFQIVDILMHYNSIQVYYGKFKNLIERISTNDFISAEYKQEEIVKTEKEEFIVEPSIDKVLNFFELQVFYVLFKQRLSESELGMLGSRVSAMEGAISKSDLAINQLTYQRRAYKKKEEQRKQIQRVVSASLSR